MKEPVTTLYARPQSDDDFTHAANMMEEGGTFAASIAKAYYFADDNNRARLKAAFPDLFVWFFNIYLTKKRGAP